MYDVACTNEATTDVGLCEDCRGDLITAQEGSDAEIDEWREILSEP